ncbi:PTS transporter subunit EIIC [Morganella morganii]|nr:PTS transporter subunit EIIC [Morganella morganii]
MAKRKFGESIQRFGRTLLLPIGVLAPIGMILGISGALVQTYMIARFPFLGNETVNALLVSIRSIAGVIFDNIPLLFAMGVAYGMSQRDKGIAVFASVVGYLSLIITMNIWLVLTGKLADPAIMGQVGQIKVLGIQTLNISAAGGIITGLIAAWATDKFYNLELPTAFAFFSGKKIRFHHHGRPDDHGRRDITVYLGSAGSGADEALCCLSESCRSVLYGGR